MTGNDPVGATGNFGNLAADYERGRQEYPQALMAAVVRSTGAIAGSLVLDVGCGTGKSTRALAASVRMVVGVDPDPLCLQTAGEQGGSNIVYRRATAEDLPFRDGTFDAVTTFSSFHWWCRVPGAVASVHRVLRTGGTFLVVNKHDTGSFRREARAIIARHSPHPLTDAKQGYDPESLLQEDGRWVVTREDLTHVERFTLPELLAQIRSLSAWNCVPEDRSAAATEELEAHFSARLGDGLFRRPLLFRLISARKPG